MELIQAKGDTWYLAAAELIPIYRLEGGRCILLDSGLESEREALSAALDRAGLTPVGVFGSHTHRDHSVNNGWLRERYGTRICLPEGEAVIASTPLMCKQVYASLSLEGLMEDCGGMVCRADETVGPEDGTAEFLGVPFRVLHAPGHTPDHICTITPDGVCYTADLMLAGPALETARLPYHYVHAVARASMEKLLQEGDYTRTKKKTSSITGVVSTVYWCVAAAVYLACSLPGHSWRESWVIWPVAGVLFAAVMAVCSALAGRKK